MRGAVYTVDPEYPKAVEEAYAAAKKRGLSSAQGYPGNNFNEYWATGIEAYGLAAGVAPRRCSRQIRGCMSSSGRSFPPRRCPGTFTSGGCDRRVSVPTRGYNARS